MCQGAGRVQRERTLNVTIPGGVEDGTRIRLSGEGEAGPRGAQPGDLIYQVEIGGLDRYAWLLFLLLLHRRHRRAAS